MFRRRNPDERIARALMKLLERDLKKKSPELVITDFSVNHRIVHGTADFSIMITGRAKYHRKDGF